MPFVAVCFDGIGEVPDCFMPLQSQVWTYGNDRLYRLVRMLVCTCMQVEFTLVDFDMCKPPLKWAQGLISKTFSVQRSNSQVCSAVEGHPKALEQVIL